jgi:hypothetical protein
LFGGLEQGGVGPLTFDIPAGASEATVEAALDALASIDRGVVVTRTAVGGPGLVWTVTFRDYGNRGQLSLVSTANIVANNGAGSPSVTVTTLHDVWDCSFEALWLL